MRLTRWFRRHGFVRAAVAAVVAAGGLAVAALTVILGHCSAFGGICPHEPPPLWENDVFGGAAFGVAVSVFAVAVAVRPDRRGLTIGAVLAVAVGGAVGLWAVAVTSTFGLAL